ncbi:MAG: aminotransferase class V-fold PLP-dependent enzyme [Planctomycetes bacterium]|nr:aminotransferase class V-fold PLP-dependent enzyme [Planctomycetota bacterium]
MIYLDNNATTMPDPAVIEAMMPFWTEHYGNPSSLHLAGQAARHAVETARAEVARLVNAKPRDIVFTSGGTEANNLAILGMLDAHPTKRHLVATAVEHVAIHSLVERLAARGFRVSFVPVNPMGHLDLAAFERELSDDTALAAVMHVNNETGNIFPIAEVSRMAADRNVPLHIDAVQAAGKLPLDVTAHPVSTMAVSAHKIHGPKGTGALYVASKTRLRSQLVGGHQERDLRPGTENVAGIVGFGVAARLAQSLLDSEMKNVAALRDRLEFGVQKLVSGAVIIGDWNQRIANTTCIAFEKLEAEAILIGLSQRGVCASSGSACSSGALEPSHVLRAMNVPADLAKGAIRFSLSRFTTECEIDEAIGTIADVILKLASFARH